MKSRLGFVTILFMILVIILAGCQKKGDPSEGQLQESENSLSQENDKEKEETVLKKPEKEFEGSFIVAVDNHKNAYPHAGIDKADKVIELLAEGGITRFLAFFDSEHAEKIGPVRSARYYFVQIARGYPSGFAHAGGNTDALALIPKLKVLDIDEIYNSQGAFYRVSDRRRPHNLYTSTHLLLENASRRKLAIESLPGLPLGQVTGGEPAVIIDIPYSKTSSYYHVVSYTYEDGKYQRFVNGKIFETEDKIKIQPENVIVMRAESRHVFTDELQSEMNIIGNGEAYFFTGGNVYNGVWKKNRAEDPFAFYYQDKPMLFHEGKTWIQIVPVTADISWK